MGKMYWSAPHGAGAEAAHPAQRRVTFAASAERARHSRPRGASREGNGGARAKEAAGRSSQGLSLFVVVLFYLFPQSPASTTPDNVRKQPKGRELSPSVALGATKLEQPGLAGLQPSQLPPRASFKAYFVPQTCQAQSQSVQNFHSNEVNAH